MVNLILLSRLNPPLLHSLAVFNSGEERVKLCQLSHGSLICKNGKGLACVLSGAACSCIARARQLAVTPQQTPNWDLGAAGRAKQ